MKPDVSPNDQVPPHLFKVFFVLAPRVLKFPLQDKLNTYLTTINDYLANYIVLSSFKHSVVTSLIKKPGFDSVFSHFKPLLPF